MYSTSGFQSRNAVVAELKGRRQEVTLDQSRSSLRAVCLLPTFLHFATSSNRVRRGLASSRSLP